MNLKLILTYLNYKITAFTEHDLHSPFVYDFYMELVRNKNPYGDFEKLDALRNELSTNTQLLDITDFGAGSNKLTSNKRSVREIAKHGIAQKKQAEFLYRLINKFNPKTIVELGTSIGLTTTYMAKAASKAKIYTIEGCPNLFNFSKELFKKQKLKNITSVNGNFNEVFHELLTSIDTLDFLYIDGNHAYEPTINYFKLALKKKNASTIIVFDDIYWSNGMEKAWKEIYTHPEVTLSLDFFKFGIVFFRSEHKNKEHFVLRS